MNHIGSVIMRLRKERGITQEQLANALGITYQAVSKWENGISSPDISTMPLLAEFFGVTLDELFGREAPAQQEEGESAGRDLVPLMALGEPEEAQQAGTENQSFSGLPWPDDDTLHVVMFVGHRLVGHESRGERLFSKKQVSFEYEGQALNIQCDFDLTVNGEVLGSVSAGGDVNCNKVGGSINAEGDVTCDDVGGSVSAGGDVSCETVGAQVNAGGDISCDLVNGSVTAGGDVTCDDVTGDVQAGGDITCGTIKGSASAGGDLNSGKSFGFRMKLT